jgi:phosphopantetheine--protein transferase-like protein
MREYVCIGTADQVLDFRAAWMTRAESVAKLLCSPFEIAPASDPFFGRLGRIAAVSQLEQCLKFELLIPVQPDTKPTACISFNYHQDHFGTSWGLRTAAGITAHSACVAFGLDRLALALFATHGVDLQSWPAAVRENLPLWLLRVASQLKPEHMSSRHNGPRLELGEHEVDLWLVPLHRSTRLTQALADTLSADEAERADRFHSARDRTRFIEVHVILRDLLSKYLGCPPIEISFAYGSSGKPQLEQTGYSRRDLRFNLSHCATAALYAFSWGKEVGVDIELIRAGLPWASVAGRFFAPREVEKLQRWPADQLTRGFFTCWTRKEAYLKARGEGLSMRLNKFEVSAAPDEAPALLAAPDLNELERWNLWDVPLGHSLAGALVTEGRRARLRLFS